VEERPEHLIGDKACDSDKLDVQRAQQSIEMIAPIARTAGRKTKHRPENQTQAEKPNTGWATAAPLQTKMEAREAFRLAAKLPARSHPL